MKIIEQGWKLDKSWRARLNRRYAPDPELVRSVSEILEQVRREGDQGIAYFVRKFDQITLNPEEFRVTDSELETAVGELEPEVRDALEASKLNVQEFANRSRRTDWLAENAQGARVGEAFRPFSRVGIYVPAGTAPLVSSAVMTTAIAHAIGVQDIVVTSPVGPTKQTNVHLLAALRLAGATEVYKIGGAQAIGALAFGTPTIGVVEKIFGPGNAFVTEAKRQVFGYVAIDLLPGPSELLVLADQTSNPAWIAADLLAQAEHGRGSVVGLVTTSRGIAEAVQKQLTTQLAGLPRAEYIKPVLADNAFALIVPDTATAIAAANAFAPEHLSIVMENSAQVATQIQTAGAIFLGNFSPVAAGDFLAGPSHELPTGGAAKSFSGLTADQFQRRTSVIEYSPEALLRSKQALDLFSRIERLDGHGASVKIRFGGG
jgi:histidinol dehydrogenase